MPIFRLYDGKNDKTVPIQATSYKEAEKKFYLERDGVVPAPEVPAGEKPKKERKKRVAAPATAETPAAPAAPTA